MKINTLNCFDEFVCTNSSCSDNCCIGWEIDIDDKTLDFYLSQKGELGDKLKQNISKAPDSHFIMKDERCPFLDKDNLCEIITKLGEDKLCDICTNHPRFYHWFDGLTEKGIGICCEEGARLLLECSEPITINTVEVEDDKQSDEVQGYDKDKFDLFYRARNIALDIVQDSRIELNQKLCILLSFGYDLTNYFEEDYGDIEEILSNYQSHEYHKECYDEVEDYKIAYVQSQPDYEMDAISIIRNILYRYEQFEMFDENWGKYIGEVSEKLPDFYYKQNLFLEQNPWVIKQYENLLCYFIYRYFMEAVIYDFAYINMNIALISAMVINCIDLYEWHKNDRHFDLSMQINIVKAYSKEFEYSEDNMDNFAVACENYPGFEYAELLDVFDKIKK